jgi:hypothetical protein
LNLKLALQRTNINFGLLIKNKVMKKNVLMLLLLSVSIASMAQPPNVAADKGSQFGEKVVAENVITVDDLVKVLADKKEGEKKINVKLKAVVTDVCTKEGCWIKIENGTGKMMVKMKDHKFLVPLALNGKEIIIEGVAEEKVTTVAQLKHYAEDANKSKAEIDAIKEPKREIVIQAKGILVL